MPANIPSNNIAFQNKITRSRQNKHQIRCDKNYKKQAELMQAIQDDPQIMHTHSTTTLSSNSVPLAKTLLFLGACGAAASLVVGQHPSTINALSRRDQRKVAFNRENNPASQTPLSIKQHSAPICEAGALIPKPSSALIAKNKLSPTIRPLKMKSVFDSVECDKRWTEQASLKLKLASLVDPRIQVGLFWKEESANACTPPAFAFRPAAITWLGLTGKLAWNYLANRAPRNVPIAGPFMFMPANGNNLAAAGG